MHVRAHIHSHDDEKCSLLVLPGSSVGNAIMPNQHPSMGYRGRVYTANQRKPIQLSVLTNAIQVINEQVSIRCIQWRNAPFLVMV